METYLKYLQQKLLSMRMFRLLLGCWRRCGWILILFWKVWIVFWSFWPNLVTNFIWWPWTQTTAAATTTTATTTITVNCNNNFNTIQELKKLKWFLMLYRQWDMRFCFSCIMPSKIKWFRFNSMIWLSHCLIILHQILETENQPNHENRKI